MCCPKKSDLIFNPIYPNQENCVFSTLNFQYQSFHPQPPSWFCIPFWCIIWIARGSFLATLLLGRRCMACARPSPSHASPRGGHLPRWPMAADDAVLLVDTPRVQPYLPVSFGEGDLHYRLAHHSGSRHPPIMQLVFLKKHQNQRIHVSKP